MSAPAPLAKPTTELRPSNRPKLREIAFDDFAAIAAFTQKFDFEPMHSRAEWEHLWVNNPANIAHGMRCPIGWVLEAAGEIVGHIASIPSLYRLGERQLLCTSGRDWAVAEEYRGYATLMLAKYLQQPGVDLAITNTANLLSCRVHFELGATVVPVGRWDVSPAWVTAYSALIADVLARKGFPLPRQLFVPASAALTVKDSWHRMQLRARAARGITVAVLNGFDERFDEFWKQLCANYPNKLLADRSRKTLQWHFHYARAQRRLRIFTASRDARLVAYAIFVRDAYRTAGSNVSRLVLADFQSLEPREGIYFSLLQSALELCRTENTALLVPNGISASGIDTSKFAPYLRKLPAPRFLYKAADPELAKLLAGPEAWCPSAYDADDTL